MMPPPSSTQVYGNKIGWQNPGKVAPITGKQKHNDGTKGDRNLQKTHVANRGLFTYRLCQLLNSQAATLKIIGIALAFLVPVCMVGLAVDTWTVIRTDNLISAQEVRFDRLDKEIYEAGKWAMNFAAPTATINGTEASNIPYDCRAILARNKSSESRVYTIQLQPSFAPKFHKNPSRSAIFVYCDMTTRNGGWIVIQRRKDGSENFYRKWIDYRNGFGELEGEFWLGLESIHDLVLDGNWELLINMNDDLAGSKYALYEEFYVGSESSQYVLTIGKYKGDAGNQLTYHNGMQFTTTDIDNDFHNTANCAISENAGWWFNACAHASLNRPYGNINWKGFSTRVESVEMKMRRII